MLCLSWVQGLFTQKSLPNRTNTLPIPHLAAALLYLVGILPASAYRQHRLPLPTPSSLHDSSCSHSVSLIEDNVSLIEESLLPRLDIP